MDIAQTSRFCSMLEEILSFDMLVILFVEPLCDKEDLGIRYGPTPFGTKPLYFTVGRLKGHILISRSGLKTLLLLYGSRQVASTDGKYKICGVCQVVPH